MLYQCGSECRVDVGLLIPFQNPPLPATATPVTLSRGLWGGHQAHDSHFLIIHPLMKGAREEDTGRDQEVAHLAFVATDLPLSGCSPSQLWERLWQSGLSGSTSGAVFVYVRPSRREIIVWINEPRWLFLGRQKSTSRKGKRKDFPCACIPRAPSVIVKATCKNAAECLQERARKQAHASLSWQCKQIQAAGTCISCIFFLSLCSWSNAILFCTVLLSAHKKVLKKRPTVGVELSFSCTCFLKYDSQQQV